MKLHVVGGLPGPLGGTTVLFDQLVRDLKKDDSIELFISDTCSIRNQGLIFKLRFLLLAIIYTIKSDVTSVHVSSSGSITIAPLLLFISKISNRKYSFRMFGGVYDQFYMSSNKPIRLIIGFILNKSDLVYFETHKLTKYFRDIFPHSKIQQYSNSRPSSKTNARVNINENYVYLGAIKKTKGVFDIIEASKFYPNVTFDFYGPILDDDFIDSISCISNCNYKGVVEPNEIIKVLASYKALLLPTYHFGEGYPGVIIEAYSIGVPVIASNWQCIPEIVLDGKTGFLINTKDIASLREAIDNLSELPPENLSKISRNCISFFNKEFNSTMLSKKFKDQINLLVNGSDTP
ncbi:glycosyltransferase [Vibrio sp. 10N.239.311.D11]|uniref:glycosyltransferase n=1 Tax=Vibrio sp. 10N.239.311.D11 TaxID=3229975 RepID=UPI00354EBB3A